MFSMKYLTKTRKSKMENSNYFNIEELVYFHFYKMSCLKEYRIDLGYMPCLSCENRNSQKILVKLNV